MILILSPPKGSHSPGPSIHSVLQEFFSASMVTADDELIMSRDIITGLLKEYRPKIVLNCYEYADIDTAEYDRERAYEINGFSLKNLSNLCREQDVMVIHLSTSLVFDGLKSSPYREDDEPDPVNVYGDSKLLGERFLTQSGCRYLLIRIPEIFGEHVPFFCRRLVAMNDDCSLRVIRGQIIAPAYAADLAKAISELISRGHEGIYHFSQEGPVETSDFMARAAELFYRYGITDKKYSVTGVEREDFLASGDRPVYNVLATGKLKAATGSGARRWEPALEEYVAKNASSIILT